MKPMPWDCCPLSTPPPTKLIPRQGSGSQGAQGSRPQQGGPRPSSPDTACDSKPKAALHTKVLNPELSIPVPDAEGCEGH